MTTIHNNPDPLVKHVRWAIDQAAAGQSQLLPRELTKIRGMSSPAGRHLLNNLCHWPADGCCHHHYLEIGCHPRYLEIGTWMGSTLVAATTMNHIGALGIDNMLWDQREKPGRKNRSVQESRVELQGNLDRVRKTCIAPATVNFIEADCNQVNHAHLHDTYGPFDIYFYDGHHSEQAQYHGIVDWLDVLCDTFILVVDDYDEGRVKRGTQRAIHDSGLIVHAEHYLTSPEEIAAGVHWDKRKWWCGYYVAVLSQPVSTMAASAAAAIPQEAAA